MSSSGGAGNIFSHRFSTSSNNSDDVINSEAFEIAVEMASGEPLRLSNQMIRNHIISTEYAQVCREPIDGLYTIPSATDPSVWFGILFIRRGVYVGAVLRFTLYLPDDFPSQKIPIVLFDEEVCHPHIEPATGELDLKRYFWDGWKPEKHHIYHILLIVQRTFFSFDADIASCVNKEAAKMLRDDREAFRLKAGEIIKRTRTAIYDEQGNDEHVIRLSRWDASLHEPLRQRLIGALTDSQISTMSMLGSLGGELTGSSVFESRGKAGYSWISSSDVTFMVEPPKPVELELKKISECDEKVLESSVLAHENSEVDVDSQQDAQSSADSLEESYGKGGQVSNDYEGANSAPLNNIEKLDLSALDDNESEENEHKVPTEEGEQEHVKEVLEEVLSSLISHERESVTEQRAD